MSADGLNTMASTFIPGGSTASSEQPFDDSFAQYAQMMDDIEAEVEAEDANIMVPPPTPITDTSALPAHLARHAAEFWYPECRDCQCCNGYKNGCSCCQTNGGVCRCTGTSGSWQPAAPGNVNIDSVPYGGESGSGKPLCKFFQSPGGCRFGDGCRFGHV
ncbi:hypothetical protein MHU86_13148 [Fragilaria crotonensis]|nr:hypothetical protein MHU86_13148 [Fragilaria crotonensis]